MKSAALLPLLACHPVKAATFNMDLEHGTFRVSGFIDRGDGKRFVDAFSGALWRTITRTVVLDSPGGSIDDAMMMAGALDGAITRTESGGTCASACVLVLASGSTVTIAPNSRVGVHQGRDAAGTVAWGDSYAMAAYLAHHHVAHEVTEKLLSKAGGDVDWLTASEEEESGWTVADAPAPAPVVPAAPVAVGTLQCVGANGQTSLFVIAHRSDGDQLYDANNDAGDVIVNASLSNPCRGADGMNWPSGTPIAGMWPKEQAVQPVSAPQTAAETVQVPRRVDLPAVVIPAPAAVPVQPVVPPAPPVFRPLPAPADEAFSDVPARCRVTWDNQAPNEADCTVGTAADGSRRVQIAGDRGFFYAYPNGAGSYLPSFDGRSFDLSTPLAVSPDRMCLTAQGFEGCAWTVQQPSILAGVNSFVGSIFGAAVSTEQRLGLLGE